MLITSYVFFPFLMEAILRACYGILSFNYFIISFLIAAINLIPFYVLPQHKKELLWGYFFLFYIPNIIDSYHILLFHGEIDSLAIRAIVDTNFQEIKEFIASFISIKCISFSFIIIGISSLLFRLNLKYKTIPILSYLVLLIYGLGICSSCFVHDKYKPTLVRMIKSYIYYCNEKAFSQKCLEERKNLSYGDITSLVDSNKKETYVIVIGESACKDHMSLYEYSKKTTPCLDKIKDRLYVFNNVQSAHCSTLAVLKEALTFDDFSKGDVVSFFKKAGFKTFWLSMQFNGGRFDNEIAMMAQQADVCWFGNQQKGLGFDALLFQPFNEALNDEAPKKVIVLHLLGSHSTYANRYPVEFQIFKDNTSKRKRIISEYDNSIAYTDYVLSQLISILESKKLHSYLLYFSDHGEDVRDEDDCVFFHSDSAAFPMMFSIPFFVWISNEYKEANSSFINKWNLSKSYKTDKLIHSILTLSRLVNKNIIEENSIFEGKK